MATKVMTKALRESEERTYAKRRMLELLGENRTVYTVLRTVSASGMSRTISLKIVDKGELIDVTYLVSKILSDKLVEANGHRALRVTGAGMDMGFHIVYNLSSVLFAGYEQAELKASAGAGYELVQRWV